MRLVSAEETTEEPEPEASVDSLIWIAIEAKPIGSSFDSRLLAKTSVCDSSGVSEGATAQRELLTVEVSGRCDSRLFVQAQRSAMSLGPKEGEDLPHALHGE